MKTWLANYKYTIVFLGVLTIVRIVLINVNITEWGDSFRILRAAKYLLNFSYPLDEKRLPLFSALLAPGLLFVEPVLWGRIFAVIMTLVNLILTAVLFKTIFPKSSQKQILLVLAFLAFNPIFFYWSLRIMAETTFTALVLLSFIIYFRTARSTKVDLTGWHKASPYILGLIISLATWTRYEGFLLAGAFGLAFLVKKEWSNILKTFGVWLALTMPWFILTKFILKGETSDAYVSELGTFQFNLQRFGYFLTHSLFALGFPPLVAILFLNFKSQITNHKLILKEIVSSPLWLFLIFEFGLFFIWTPSLPRIMLPVLPILIIFVVDAIITINKDVVRRPLFIAAYLISIIAFLILQLKFKLYFLVLSRTGLAIIVALSLIGLLTLVFRFKRLFVASILVSLVVGSTIVVANQRLVYSTIYEASIQAKNLTGQIAYSDETGVSAWYLGDRGTYLSQNLVLDVAGQANWLKENKISYILDTNEFNRGSKLDVTSLNCQPRFEVTISDILDSALMSIGLFTERSYPKLYSQVCNINT